MAVISALAPTPVYYTGIDNPYLSNDMYGFALPQWPPHHSYQFALPAATVATHWPVEANGREISGYRNNSYADDFYYRVHVIPARLDLGNVVSAQTAQVRVWNAFFTPKLLTAIAGVEEGLSLTGQPGGPLNFAPLQERQWDVSVGVDGPFVLDATIQWIFADAGSPRLRITGNRITALPFRIDWTEGVRERLIWATSVVQSPTGKEQRRALRVSPNRELSAPVILDQRERQAFNVMMFGWGSRVFAIPVWFDVQSIAAPLAVGAMVIPCDTLHRDFRAGGLAMLMGETSFRFETVEILSVTPTQLNLKRATLQQWPAGTDIYPVRTAALISPPQLTRKSDNIQTARVDFEMMEPCEWPAIFPSTLYRGWPVFDAAPDESQDLTSQYQNLMLRLDNGFAMPVITDTADLAFFTGLHRWALLGRVERAAHRSLLYALAGRHKAVWIPTHADDLTLNSIIPIGSTIMDVASIGYTRFGQAKISRRDIRVELRNGSVFYRRIIACAEITESVERLQLDASFPVEINPADIYRISWLMLMRGDSDAVEIEHVNDGDGAARSQQIFRSVADEL